MLTHQLSLLQIFNAMQTFLNMYYDKTHASKIGVMAGSLNLWKTTQGWQLNPQTFDPRAWDEWLKCMNKTLDDFNIQKDPTQFSYDEEISFLCMQNYFKYFYNQTSWQDVKKLIESLEQTKHIDTDPVWQEWQKAIQHVLNNSYELDVYFDPLTGDRM